MSPLVKRLLLGFAALVAVVVGGATGFWVLGEGDWSSYDCLYMTVITVTTVGYSETLVHMETVHFARTWAMLLLLFGTGAIVYFASMVTALIVEGELKDVLFSSKLKKRIKRMQDHVVVCGVGPTGRNVVEELLKTGVPVIAIDLVERELKEIAAKYPKATFSYLVGDATDDDVLAQANLPAARGLVAAMSSDKDNLYITVSARQAYAHLRIVARAAELTHVDKLKKSGADAVVSPEFIGGMRLVSEMMRPAVVKFLDDMLRDKRAAYRIEDVKIGASLESLGTTLGDARIRDRFGMSVLALRPSDADAWTYNPEPDSKLVPGMTLVVLGDPQQVSLLRQAAGDRS